MGAATDVGCVIDAGAPLCGFAAANYRVVGFRIASFGGRVEGQLRISVMYWCAESAESVLC